MFKPSCNSCNTRSQMALDITLRKANTGQEALSFYGPKVLTKISQHFGISQNIFGIFNTCHEERNFKQFFLLI